MMTGNDSGESAIAAAAIISQPQLTEGLKLFTSREKEWSTSLLGCCGNCKESCLFCLCPCYFQCLTSKRMRESFLVPFCVPGGLMGLRIRLRSKLDIEGSICSDCCVTTLCGPCAGCQISRELDHIGIPKFPMFA